MQSHKSVIINGAMTSQLHMRGPEDVVVSALPCPHVYANVLMTGMMMFGTKLVLHQVFDPLNVFKDIEKHKQLFLMVFLQCLCLCLIIKNLKMQIFLV
jgi:long-chain acyl-CoA synthetase